MFNEWSVWSLRHWSMVYSTATDKIFYLYSQINMKLFDKLFCYEWPVSLWFVLDLQLIFYPI